jgi:hypothetical protein
MLLFTGTGLGVNGNLAAAAEMMRSLIGHMIFGAILGLVDGRMRREHACRGVDA